MGEAAREEGAAAMATVGIRIKAPPIISFVLRDRACWKSFCSLVCFRSPNCDPRLDPVVHERTRSTSVAFFFAS